MSDRVAPRFAARFVPTLALVGCSVFGSVAVGAVTSDDFNRPNSTNMGPNWVEVHGNTAIQNNKGKGASGAFTQGWMHHASFTGNYADSTCAVDFQASGIGENVVLMVGLDPNTWGCVSVKIQDNTGDGLFDRVFFEQAFNAGSWGNGNPVIYDLATPTASGRMTVSFDNDGDVAVCTIQNNASSQVETCSASGILAFAFPITGTRFGIGHSGGPFFDNWTADTYKPAYGTGCAGSGGFVPALDAPQKPIGGAPFDLEVTNGLGGAPCFFFFGLGQTAAPIGLSGCSLWITPILPPSFSIPLAGSGAGNGTITLSGTMPVVPVGTTFTMQAFIADAGVPHGFTATNGLLLVVE
ncbi:MAG: hypothetical protein JNL94_11150 [Planctomycetes bacterium]|nr:hypothetical protein [Planctomycetota bacterium]